MKNRANPENCRELNRKYLATEKGKAARYRATKLYRERHQKKLKAHNAVTYALRLGRLYRWPVCAMPDCSCETVHAHHPDYDRPLDVVWLCQTHHKQAHALLELESA